RALFTAPVGATAVRREEGGASFTVPVGISTAVRARGTLEPERRAAPSPATSPRPPESASSDGNGERGSRLLNSRVIHRSCRSQHGGARRGGSVVHRSRRSQHGSAGEGKVWSRSAGPPQARRPSPRGIGLRTRKTRGRHYSRTAAKALATGSTLLWFRPATHMRPERTRYTAWSSRSRSTCAAVSPV